MTPAGAAHPGDAGARTALHRAAADSGLEIAGGALLRTSSRFCLSVEHGDYNGTDLFGVGTDRFTWIGWRTNGRGTVRLFSAGVPDEGVVEFRPGELPPPQSPELQGRWSRFPLGAAFVLERTGIRLRAGLDAVVVSDIPGGGMSRSASLSVGLLLLLAAANGHRLADRMELARLAQAVENDYVGSPCGLLDPLMICHARAGHGAHWSARDGAVRHVPLGGDQGRLRLLSLDTGRPRHGLEHATYPRRRRECEELASLLHAEFGHRCLADVRTPQQLDAVLRRFWPTHPHHCARLRYVHAAQARLEPMLAAFGQGDFAALGALFRADGQGLRDDYAISGPELETMCDIVRTVEGVLGERMLGGGDCGAAGALVLAEAVPAVRAAVDLAYPRSHPRWAGRHAVHELRTVDGIAELPLG
jgi:galactokinase